MKSFTRAGDLSTIFPCFLQASLLIAFTACSNSTPHQDLQESQRRIRNIRRLAIAPIKYKTIDGSIASFFGETINADDFKEQLLAHTYTLLQDWKGYELVPFGQYEDILWKELQLPDQKIHQRIQQETDALADWAQQSARGAIPPQEIADLVSRMGRALDVDGILLIQGFNESPNYTLGLRPFTAGLSALLFPLEANNELRADVYDTRTGRIVWSRKVSIIPYDASTLAEQRDPEHWISLLFDPMENAGPKVLMEKR